MSKRRFPSRRERRALELGADELIGLLEWRLRARPRGLRGARRLYRQVCLELLERLERRP